MSAWGDEADLSDGKIDRFEFLCFMLVKNGVIEMRNIEDAMKNFNELDKTRNGYLESFCIFVSPEELNGMVVHFMNNSRHDDVIKCEYPIHI